MNEVEYKNSTEAGVSNLVEIYSALGIGPATSHLLACTFSQQALIGHEQAAQILGMTGKTLRALGDEGIVTFRLKGSRNRTYSESDIIRLISGTTAKKERKQCPSINQATQNTGNTTSNGKGKGFMDQRGKLANAARNKSKAA